MENSPDDLLTIAEVAAILKLSTSAVYALANSGELESFRIGASRGRVRVRRAAIAAHLNAGKQRKTEPAMHGSRSVRISRQLAKNTRNGVSLLKSGSR